MSEYEQRTAYNNTRILIESSRILDPQFDDAILHITGAQLELLRNVAQYLDRITTFVAEYEPQCYLTPTSDDWNDITYIVANLQEKLMGNENVIFGYNAPLFKDLSGDTDLSGNFGVWTETPPVGEIWIVHVVSILDRLNNPAMIRIRVDDASDWFVIKQATSPGTNVPLVYSGMFVIANGKKVFVEVQGSGATQPIIAVVIGYKMQVST